MGKSYVSFEYMLQIDPPRCVRPPVEINYLPNRPGPLMRLDGKIVRQWRRKDGRWCVLVPAGTTMAHKRMSRAAFIFALSAGWFDVPAWADIHHLDGDCSNDMPANLLPMQRGDHHRYHQWAKLLRLAEGQHPIRQRCRWPRRTS